MPTLITEPHKRNTPHTTQMDQKRDRELEIRGEDHDGQNHAGNPSNGSMLSWPKAELTIGTSRKRKLEEKEKEVEEIEITHHQSKPPTPTSAQRSRPAVVMSTNRPEQRRASSEPPLSTTKRQRVQQTAIFDPPITTRSLRELELNEILRNGKLRHDCVYDRLLHFRPNVEGRRGKKKQDEARKYWEQIRKEIERLKVDVSECVDPEIVQKHLRFLPAMFSNIRDILLTLVPKADRPAIRDVMDDALIKQRLVRGVFDISAFAQWLAGLLKCHCAPMRDKSVHRFTERISYGVAKNNVSALVEGLRLVFEVLEAMRLVSKHPSSPPPLFFFFFFTTVG